MGRYYCVRFVYNLRFFGKKGSKNIRKLSRRFGPPVREPSVWDAAPLPEAGSSATPVKRYARPGLVEEYTI